MKYKFSSEDKLFLNYKGLSWKMPSLKLVLYCVCISFFPFIFLDLLTQLQLILWRNLSKLKFRRILIYHDCELQKRTVSALYVRISF